MYSLYTVVATHAHCRLGWLHFPVGISCAMFKNVDYVTSVDEAAGQLGTQLKDRCRHSQDSRRGQGHRWLKKDLPTFARDHRMILVSANVRVQFCASYCGDHRMVASMPGDVLVGDLDTVMQPAANSMQKIYCRLLHQGNFIKATLNCDK